MICKNCNNDKGDDFRKNRLVCRECDNEIRKEDRLKIKNKEKPAIITCSVCKEKKTEFRINRNKCLDCERTHGKEYRRTTDKAKTWVLNNAEKMSELQHKWYEQNKKYVQQKVNLRYISDDKFKVRKNHSSAISKMISGKVKTSKYLNCSRDRLLNWLQFQMTECMSFSNYGDMWVIDHVIPVKMFLNDELPADVVFSWLNIQPVLCLYNLKKNMYIDTDQCSKHLENIKHYCRIRKVDEDKNYISALETKLFTVVEESKTGDCSEAFEINSEIA